jgi:hypothetical protein
MRKVAWLAAVVTLVASGSYFFVYLYRWEWHRALMTALLFLSAEVALASALLYRRIGKLASNLSGRDGAQATTDPAVVQRLEGARRQRDHFAWLESPVDSTAVFIPVLLGSGVIVSAVAWVIERIAGRTAEPAMERGLARRLSAISLPDGGLVPDEAELLAQDGPSTHDEDLALLLGPGARR